MHKTVVLGALQNLVNFVARDVAAAIGLYDVVRHIAHRDAPIAGIIAATLAQASAAHAAGAGAGGVLALVLVEPMLDMLNGHGLVLGLDSLLDGNDVQTDAATSQRHHSGCLGQRVLGRLLEELGHNGMLVQLALAHVHELGGTGHQHGQNQLLGAGGILPVVLEQADVAHLVQKLLKRFGIHAGRLGGRLKRIGLAHLHLQQHVGHLIGRGGVERPVLIR